MPEGSTIGAEQLLPLCKHSASPKDSWSKVGLRSDSRLSSCECIPVYGCKVSLKLSVNEIDTSRVHGS